MSKRKEQLSAKMAMTTSLLSFLIFFIIIILILIFITTVNSANLFFDWHVSYSQRSPLGKALQVIVINNMFPGPLLNVTTDDVVNVNVHNHLTHDPFLITWNGVQMRKCSWQDGAEETNCPILPGQSWTYSFQVKDQIGSFFYFPSLPLQKAAGGYGAIRVNNLDIIPLPFPLPYNDFDVLIGDWYNAAPSELRDVLDNGNDLPNPDGILINGKGPYQHYFVFEPGRTYRLRISNVGLKTSLNFRIEDHDLLLVETEGSYTIQRSHRSLDIHVGQSYSVLVTARNTNHAKSYYMVATPRFTILPSTVSGIAVIRFPGSVGNPSGPLPPGPVPLDYACSMNQARNIRWNLSVPAARANPQGSYHYGNINITRTVILENGFMTGADLNHRRCTVNGISFVHPDTPLKLADYFGVDSEFELYFPERPPRHAVAPSLGISVIDAVYDKDFFHIVFENPLPHLQTWHINGFNFWVVGMDWGRWDERDMENYNMIDAISRSTVEVYPFAWTAIVISLDNQGMWNLRSQHVDNWFLGQELYLRVKDPSFKNPVDIPPRIEAPIPKNVLLCGRVAHHLQ